MHRIKFKNKSNTDFANLFVHDIGEKSKPKERVIVYDNIPGRSGSLIEHTGIYETYERTIVLVDVDGNHDLRNWLIGSGNLEISTEPDGYYKASVTEEFRYQIVKGIPSKYIEIPFTVQPFFYLNAGIFPKKVTSESTFLNHYGIPARPLIKVIGNGNLKFYHNNKLVTINNVAEYVFIDSELFICYDSIKSKAKDMIGDYPIFTDKINALKPVNCTLEVTPRWCRI